MIACRFGQPGVRSRKNKAEWQPTSGVKDKAKLPSIDVSNLRLTRKLGQGGLGTVYQGFLEGNPVAIKRYRHQPKMYNNNPDQDREALHTEARLLQSVKHPNVVDVLCFVVEDGILNGFAMELLGESLHKSSSKGHLSHSRLAKAFRQTCQAVSHLHGMLVAHLDIKPSSICWKDYSSCSIKLIDFDSALQLKHHDQVLPRLHGDLCVQSPERVAKSPCLALDEDNYMSGHTFYTLIGETHGNRAAEELRARAMRLLRPAGQRPSTQDTLQHWYKPIEDEP